MNLSNIRLGDKIIIYDKNKEYISFVECIIEKNKILFQNIFEYNQEINLQIENKYNFVFFTDIGEFQVSCKIISYLDEGRRRFYLAEIDESTFSDLKKQQRRKNTRFYCNLYYSIQIISNDKKEKINCIIKDIGFGGVRFVTNSYLEKDVSLELKLVTSEDFFFGKGEIIQYQNYPKSNYKNQYRVKFFETDFSNTDFFKKYFDSIKKE